MGTCCVRRSPEKRFGAMSERDGNDEDIRPCVVCGAPVTCEPDYPGDVRVVCAPCIATTGARLRALARELPPAVAVNPEGERGKGDPDRHGGDMTERPISAVIERPALVLRAFGRLAYREQRLLALRFGIGPDEREHSHDEIARYFNITVQRVHLIEQQALRKLDAALNAR